MPFEVAGFCPQPMPVAAVRSAPRGRHWKVQEGGGESCAFLFPRRASIRPCVSAEHNGSTRGLRSIFVPTSLGLRRRAHLYGEAFLGASEAHGKNEPSNSDRQSAQRNSSDFHAERLQSVEYRGIQGIGTTQDHHVDHVLCLIFLIPSYHCEEYLARGIGNGKVHPALRHLKDKDDCQTRRQS